VRKLGAVANSSHETCREFIETRPAETVASILVCLIHHANNLLDQLLRRQKQGFLEEGGRRDGQDPLCRPDPQPGCDASGEV